MAEMKITIPNRAELQRIKPQLSDYAIALGALRLDTGRGRPQGQALRRDVADLGQGVMDQIAGYNALLPRFINPAAAGVDTLELDGESILTMDNKVAYFPKLLAPSLTTDALWRELMAKTLPRVGAYHCDAPLYYASENPCYHYQGRNYVHVLRARPFDRHSVFANGDACEASEDYWFVCKPVRAQKEPDGSIQCQDLLLPCRFTQDMLQFQTPNLSGATELNPDDFWVGKFMRAYLLPDLQRSTNLVDTRVNAKLTALRTPFVKTALKSSGREI